jgi:methyl-accepting chemotaxis protein
LWALSGKAKRPGEQSKTISAVLKKIKDSVDKVTKSTDNVLNKFEAIDGGVRTVSEQKESIRGAIEEQSAGRTKKVLMCRLRVTVKELWL